MIIIPEVTLTKDEALRAKQWTDSCTKEAKEKHYKEKLNGPIELAYEYDLSGYGAELAFCKWKKIPWSPIPNGFKKPDVLSNIQVRNTFYHNGHLAVRPDDKQNKDHFFVLTIGRIPHYKIIGFLRGEDCMKDKWWKNPNGGKWTWWIPNNVLKHTDFLDCSGENGIDLTEKIDENQKQNDILKDVLEGTGIL